MQRFIEHHNKLLKSINLVVPVHPPPRYCRVPHTRLILLDDSGFLLPTLLILNQYLADSTKIDKIRIIIVV